MYQSHDEQKREKGEHDDASKNNILTQEIDSWSKYEYALREECRPFFNHMLALCKEKSQLA